MEIRNKDYTSKAIVEKRGDIIKARNFLQASTPPFIFS